MTKRYKFQCWNCPKVYFQPLDITDQQQLIVACPYCHAEALVDLNPYHNQTKIVIRGENQNTQSDEELQLPHVLPTRELD